MTSHKWEESGPHTAEGDAIFQPYLCKKCGSRGSRTASMQLGWIISQNWEDDCDEALVKNIQEL
jgi:hypothetical protein